VKLKTSQAMLVILTNRNGLNKIADTLLIQAKHRFCNQGHERQEID
jgi:hypothetical protein